jgi:hypothetical protein
MVDTGAYRFADLQNNGKLLDEIVQLESKLQRELGQDVALIAYSKTGENKRGVYFSGNPTS